MVTVFRLLRACAAASDGVMGRFVTSPQFCKTEKLKHQNRTNIKEVRVRYLMACRVLKSGLKLPAGAAVIPCKTEGNNLIFIFMH